MSANKEVNPVEEAFAASTNPKDTEYDLVKSLLAAADFRNTEDAVTEIAIRRGEKYYYTFHIMPISEEEVRTARKKATSYMKNPQGAKYPQIEKDFNSSLFNSWLIYLATTKDDREKIWGNAAVKQKYGLMENVESIDRLLLLGEKSAVVDKIIEISGLDAEESFDAEDYAKKS